MFSHKTGGIYNQGNLTLNDVTVTGNTAQEFPRIEVAQGGGIYNSGVLVTTDSRIIDNQGFFGGGIFSSRTLTTTNTTISGNEAIRGGGIYGDATPFNTTVAFNRLFEPEFPELFPDETLVFPPDTIGGGGLANGTYTLVNSILIQD